MILITQEFTKIQLCQVAKKCGLKKYSSMNKTKLLYYIQQHFAASTISKYFLKKVNNKKNYINNNDPLTQCEIKRPYFEIELFPSKYVRYNMIQFYNYMIKTGKFKDPFTETEFSNKQLEIMDNQLKNNNFMKQSLVAIKNNPNKINYYKRMMERDDCLLGMDRQIGELLTNMCDNLFDKLQNGGNVEHTCYHTLSHTFLPNLVYLLDELKQIDIQYTKNCLYDYISWVKNQNVPLGHIITNLLKKELHHLT